MVERYDDTKTIFEFCQLFIFFFYAWSHIDIWKLSQSSEFSAFLPLSHCTINSTCRERNETTRKWFFKHTICLEIWSSCSTQDFGSFEKGRANANKGNWFHLWINNMTESFSHYYFWSYIVNFFYCQNRVPQSETVSFEVEMNVFPVFWSNSF